MSDVPSIPLLLFFSIAGILFTRIEPPRSMFSHRLCCPRTCPTSHGLDPPFVFHHCVQQIKPTHGPLVETDLLGTGTTGRDADTTARVAARKAGRADGLATLLAGFLAAELHRTSFPRFGADSTARVAALETGRAHSLAALFTPRDTELLCAALSRFNADAAALVAALLTGLAGSRATLCFLARRDGDGRADMGSARHAGLDAKAAGRVAADRPGLAHRVSTLGILDRDALGPAVDFQAGGASDAPDRSTSDCVTGAEIDRVAVNSGGDQEG